MVVGWLVDRLRQEGLVGGGQIIEANVLCEVWFLRTVSPVIQIRCLCLYC